MNDERTMSGLGMALSCHLVFWTNLTMTNPKRNQLWHKWSHYSNGPLLRRFMQTAQEE